MPGRASATEDPWSVYVVEASIRFGVPQGWIRRVMAVESRGRTMLAGRPIRSPKGAMGLMQLMPGTWQQMRLAYGLGDDPDDPRDNILAGTAYLRLMYDRFGYPGLFAAYNAGPGRYRDYLSGGMPLPRETVSYVASVGRGTRSAMQTNTVAAAPPTIFAIDRGRVAGDALRSVPTPRDTLIVIRRD